MKKPIPSVRSSSTMRKAIAINCVNTSVISVVPSDDQMKIGMRKNFIPGARNLKIVVRILTAPRMVENPLR